MMTSLKSSIALAAIVLSAVVSAVGGPQALAAQPQIHFPVQSYLFPPVIEGDSATHDFVIENHGTAPLEITGVRTD